MPSSRRNSSLINKVVKIACITCLALGTTSIIAADIKQPLQAAPVIATQKTIQKKYTIKEITGLDGFLLSGANATQVLYLPVPREWTLDTIDIQLSLYSSSLVTVPSTLTAILNGKPISLIRLTDKFNINDKWNITIPGDLVTDNIVNVTFNNVLDDFGNNCYNLTSPKFWLYITGSSTITYNYHVDDFNPDLTKYPYPFVNNPAIQKDVVVVVFPDEPSLDEYNAAFYLVNSLINKSSWLGIDLIATSIKDLSDDQKNNNNLIFIGTYDKLHLSDLPVKWPLSIDTKIYDAKHNPIASDIGVIMLSRSPWNAKNAILAITGNDENAVLKAADMLRNPEFPNTVLFNQYALIANHNKQYNYHPTWTDTTFSDLNYTNKLVYGGGQNPINYDIDLPMDKTIKGLYLEVDYSTSPFLSDTDKSFLMLRVNDNPVTGIAITPGSEKISKWKVYIDGNNLHNGTNKISFIFNLYNRNQHCKPEDTSLVWGTIYNSSTIHLDLTNTDVFLNFKMFKSSPTSLTVSIPDNDPYFKSIPFAQQILKLGKDMPLVDNIKFIYNKDFDFNTYGGDNLLYIGDVNNQKNLDLLFKNAPFLLTHNQLIIDPRLKPYVTASHEIPITINELIRSPINPDKFIMLMLANNIDGFENGIELFTNEKKSSLIDGNAVLLYENGTFTSIKADKIIYTTNKKIALNKYLAYSLYTIVLLGIIIFISRKIYKRFKKYVTPKHE